jgi:hypothetical protein
VSGAEPVGEGLLVPGDRWCGAGQVPTVEDGADGSVVGVLDDHARGIERLGPVHRVPPVGVSLSMIW